MDATVGTPVDAAGRTPGQRAFGRRALEWAAGVAVVWAAMAGTGVWVTHRLVVAAATRSGPAPAAPAWVRFALLGFEVTSAAVWAVVGAAALGGAAELVRHVPGVRRAARWVSPAVVTLGLWVAFLVYGLSWGTFWTAGSFIDHEGVRFWLALPHPGMVVQWSTGWLLWGVPTVALAAACLMGLGLPALVRRVPGRPLMVVVGSAAAAAVGIAAFSLAAGPSQPPARDGRELLGAIDLTPKRLWEIRRYRCGPCATALLDLTDQVLPDPSIPQPDPSVRVEYRPQISMAEYLRQADRSAARPWNVIVVEVESMRPDALRVYGGTREVMPHVDALAAESRVFANAHTQAVHSNYAVACPLCSEYPMRSSREYRFPARVRYPHVMIYDVLKAIGYHVGVFSSSNELWSGQANLLQTGSVDAFHDAESWKAQRGATYVDKADPAFASWVEEAHRAGVVDDRFTVNLATDWMDRQPGPFFAYLNFQSSHFPYTVPADFPRRYSAETVSFPMTFDRYPADQAAVVRGRYDDSLRYVDFQLGRLIDHLKAKGAWDRTLLVLTGDHGQAFYEHGLPTHANGLYAEAVDVPLLVRAPGLAAGVDPYPAEHVDVPPSILHLLGLPPHPAYQGLDLFAADRPPDRSIFTMVQTPLAEQVAVIQGGLKLIHDLRDDSFALFDESADPRDTVNRINDPALHGRAAQMDDRLRSWRAVQLAYYNNALHQAECYPPVLPDR